MSVVGLDELDALLKVAQRSARGSKIAESSHLSINVEDALLSSVLGDVLHCLYRSSVHVARELGVLNEPVGLDEGEEVIPSGEVVSNAVLLSITGLASGVCARNRRESTDPVSDSARLQRKKGGSCRTHARC